VDTPHPSVNYKPHAVQTLFHEDCTPWRWFCAGYGVGKTTVGVIEAFTNATITHPGYLGIVAAPTFPLLMQAWFNEWKQWIPQEWWVHKQDPKKGDELWVRTPEGQTSKILLRSTSNPSSNEGVNAAWLVFDEAPREKNRASIDVLSGRLRRGYPGRPRGAIFTGPPQKRTHWTAQEFGTGPDEKANRPGHSRHWRTATHSVIRARTRDNPYLPPDYEPRLRSRPGATKAWCKQYLDAQFGAMEGQVWAAFSRDVHVVPAASLRGRQWRRTHGGVDWGWAHPGCMLVAGEDGVGNIYILAEEVHEQRTITDTPGGWVTIGATLTRAHKVDRWFCDPSQPQAMETLQRGLRKVRLSNVYGADNDVAEGLRRVAALMEWAVERANRTKAILSPKDYRPGVVPIVGENRPGLYISDACVKLIACIEDYSRKKDKDGNITEQPEKTGDDPADALRYLVMGATNP
jgi:hypothetical protein